MAVNGVKTPDWAAFIEARARDNEHMTVELIREGTLVRLEIELLQHSAAPQLEPPSLLADIIGRDAVQLDALLGLKKSTGEKN